MKTSTIVTIAGIGALAYLWYQTAKQKAQRAAFLTATSGKKVACPTGYAFYVDANGQGSCQRIIPTGAPVSMVRASQDMVYDQNGNLVPLSSVF